MVLNTEWAQVEVIDLINDGSGLAFGIIGGRSTGVVVKTILPGGVADRDGRLQSGDHILQIGEVNLRGLGSEQVASVLRQCGVHVRMVVARPVESTTTDYTALGSHAPIVPTKILGDPVELDRHLIENGYAEALSQNAPSTFTTPFIYTGQQQEVQLHPISGMVDVVKNPLPIGAPPIAPQVDVHIAPKMLPLDMALHEPDLPETETFSIQLEKDDLGLGITVAGYVCEKEEISGIFVKSISKGSAADAKNIKINDRIIEVDGKSVVGFTNHQAVELLRNTGCKVNIKIERYLRGPKYEQLQQAIRANELRPPSPASPSASSLPKVPLSLVHMSYLGIEPEGESRTSFDFDSTLLDNAINEEEEEIVIDGTRSLQFSIESHDSIQDKWKDRIKDSELVIAQMQKEPNIGLGISLEGTVDVEDGKEVRPHHYIRNILPDGPVGKNGILQPGDELLEVNGLQLLGLNHLEVVSILKRLPSLVCLVCARCPIPNTRVIDTSQRREAFQARKILAGSLQTLIPISECNNRLVKAKSETSIVSSMASDTCTGSRSRSLELIAGLPMWSDEPTIVELNKGDHGLGFSILDYQDPLNPQETVIVVRSLVPGGVAQSDGRLIPGDRLLAVNDINVEHATLDRAVQVLKSAQKGKVKIAVAKPLTTDTVSHASQDTEEDQTCLEDFQECIEEYQECLEVVHICIEDDSFDHSAGSSQVEELGQHCRINQLIENNFLNANTKSKTSIGDSDIDISFKTTNDNHLDNKITEYEKQVASNTSKNNNNRTDSLTLSNLTQSSNLSEKDGYETCIDESLSEDQLKTELTPKLVEIEEVTPTNSIEDGLKCYDDRGGTGDEFFLVQYPPEVLDPPRQEEKGAKKTFKKCLKEYYNDYEDCLGYKPIVQIEEEVDKREEMADDDIFGEVLVSVKSQSAPDIMDSSFVTMTYDPGPEKGRRKSAFFPGYLLEESERSDPMTVIRPIDTEYGALKGCHVDDMLHKHWGATHTVRLFREPNKSLGISIVGGKVDLQRGETGSNEILGIFVKTVVPDSPAGKTGLFKTGDRILEVSGVDLSQASHEDAVQAIRNASNPVVFVVQSILPWSPDTNEAPECPSPLPSPVSSPKKEPENSIQEPDSEPEPSTKIEVEASTSVKVEALNQNDIESSEEEDDDEDIRELEGRTVSSQGQQIDRASAANVKRSKEEIAADLEKEDIFGYTMNKVKKKYANLGHSILMVQLERSNQGLGLSLAGHKDRNCMAVFVCGLNPNGSAFKTGGIQIGDEILEVNGVVLHGRCHLNASAIIKGLSGPIFKVIILRRKTAIDDIAVKPITQFPVSLAEEATEEQFSANYPNVRTVAIKKGNQSLGIMIIEGKHAEVGQGIFISDIQEGSSAEKAGLEIGEMILAVNKDSLVGSNYDTAANLLKRTEGLVSLVVSNPGKKEAAPQNSGIVESSKTASGKSVALKAAVAPPSRPATPVPEPPADPATCPIVGGRETTIEITTDNKGLGVYFIGGKDTAVASIVIVDVFAGGAADKDGRLQPGDHLLDVNGASLKDVTNQTASQALRQTLPKIKLTVMRPVTIDCANVEVDLMKKPGKGLGLSLKGRKNGKGVYVADVVSGGTADVDGRITRGDLLQSINGKNVENSTSEEVGATLKTVTGKVSLKLNRFKPIAAR